MADETKVVTQNVEPEEKQSKRDLPASTKTLGLMKHIALYKQAQDPTLTQGQADKLIKERLQSPLSRMDKWEMKQRDPELLREGMTVEEYYKIRDQWDKEHPERVKEINQFKKAENEKNRGPLTDNLKRGLKDRGIAITEGMTFREGRIAIYKWAKENPDKEAALQKKYEMRKDAAMLELTPKQEMGLKLRGIEQTEGMSRGAAAKAIHDFDVQNPGVAQKAYEAYNAEKKERESAEKAQEVKTETKEKSQAKAKPKAKIASKSKQQSKAKTKDLKK